MADGLLALTGTDLEVEMIDRHGPRRIAGSRPGAQSLFEVGRALPTAARSWIRTSATKTCGLRMNLRIEPPGGGVAHMSMRPGKTTGSRIKRLPVGKVWWLETLACSRISRV